MAEDKAPQDDSSFRSVTNRALTTRRDTYDIGDGVPRRVVHNRVDVDDHPLLVTEDESRLPLRQGEYDKVVQPTGYFHSQRFDTMDAKEKADFDQLMTWSWNNQLRVVKSETYGLLPTDPPDRYVSVWWVDIFVQPDPRLAAALRAMNAKG
jgi:hypothetical protein